MITGVMVTVGCTLGLFGTGYVGGVGVCVGSAEDKGKKIVP